MGKKETTLTQEEKEFFMREAIAEAKKAEGLAEVPIGAVIVRQGEIKLASRRNPIICNFRALSNV